MVKMMISSFYLVFLTSLLFANAEWISIVARKPKNLIIFQVDTETGNATEARTVLNGINEKSLTNFILDVKNASFFFVLSHFFIVDDFRILLLLLMDGHRHNKIKLELLNYLMMKTMRQLNKF